ncbi:MAG: protein translocase subunit SecDF [Bacteroidales bacterium OttesenSCG-928-I14]|jgi:SecD/SecF fusion protein|nr:protein translocase subunit SecDF [Bacteroidales bacterium OttesenSCG-928-I14]
MQNKGFIKFLFVALTLVSIFYLSFTFITNKYYKQAKKYSCGIPSLESRYIDSLAKEKVWLGYSLEKCRAMEVNLGLDLKGGMNVIIEIAARDVLKSLSDNNSDPIFNKALAKASELQCKKKCDFLSSFASVYKGLDRNAKLSTIFGTYELREKIHPQSTNDDVISVLRTEMKNSYDNSFNVLRNRIDMFGVTSPNIQRIDSEGLISIELPGVKDANRVRDLLQGTANLEFWETYLESEIHHILFLANNIIKDSIQFAHQMANNIDIKSVESASSKKYIDKNLKYPLFVLMGLNPEHPRQSCVVASVKKNEKSKIDSYLANSKVRDLLDTNRVSLKWTIKPFSEKNNLYDLVALKVNYIDNRPKPVLSGDVIQNASDHFEQNSNCAEVSMVMKNDAAKVWARLTKDNIGRAIAIVLDDYVYSFPIVSSEITDGSSRITGNFNSEQAKDLVNILKSGKISARAKIVQEEIVGPSLGQQAINSGFISFAVALIVLIFYLILIYGLIPGMISSSALLLNLFFSLGIMASFHVVLTLSGIAGIVLSLALAVDANVLIYERIKEEIRRGKMLKNAIEEGYVKAFSAIFDANFTSLITGVILLIFGTGPIRGFAFTLIIGIVVSFFTAVFLTHLAYDHFLLNGKLKNLTFITKLSKNFLVSPNFNFLKNLNSMYIVVSVITIAFVASFLIRGLNKSIDYTGGRNYIIKFDRPINTVQAQKLLKPFFKNHIPNVITIGTPNQVRISTNYMVDSNDFFVDSIVQIKLFKGLKNFLHKRTTYNQFISKDYIQSQQKVGPSIAENLKQKAVWAVGLSVFAIGLYILLRFRDISYSVSSIISLVFDVVFILGVYALLWGLVPFSLEVDQTFIGAILTVVGYSINDKVVIFDRVREYIFLYPKKNKFDIFNSSLNSTLDRTFNTSMSTLLVLLIIFSFGGESIRSFSFSMILGVVVSTFSSLFVSASIAYKIQVKRTLK